MSPEPPLRLPLWLRLCRALVVSFGILVFGVAISYDWLNPGTSDLGFGLMQQLLAALGAIISAAGYYVPTIVGGLSNAWRATTWGTLFQKAGLAMVSILATLLLIEMMLLAAGFPPGPAAVPPGALTLKPWWFCDDQGCRVDPTRLPPEGFPAAIINPQGFNDKDEFVASDDLKQACRILFLGDSLTWGASADLGQSWVDLFEAGARTHATCRAMAWNAGVPGTGTEQALAVSRMLVPMLKPQVVLLAFYVGNDFDDNLYPMDRFLRVVKGVAINQYEIDGQLVARKISPEDAWYRAQGLDPISRVWPITRVVRQTRAGYMASRGIFRLRFLARATIQASQLEERKYSTTRALLSALRDYVTANRAELIVMVIPNGDALSPRDRDYQRILRISRELSLSLIEPLPNLVPADYNLPTDEHWNNDGHRKAGEIVLQSVMPVLERRWSVSDAKQP